MKKAIVTGGAGFIGSNLVDKLIDMGIQVSVIDDFSTGKMENTNKKAHYWKQDLSKVDIDELTQFMEGVDIVFHLAALARVQPSIEDPITFNKVNVDGTLNILWAAHKAGIKRVVYSASSSCYGNNKNFPTPETEPTNPLSPYGLQKYLGEHYCKMFSEVYGLDTVSLRYFNVYGERMLLEKFISGREFTCAVLQLGSSESPVPLPIVEVIAPDGNYNFHNKYEGDKTKYICPPKIPLDVTRSIEESSVKAFKTLGCRHWARVDFIWDENGEPEILELNTVPGMTEKSLVPMAASKTGLTFDDLVLKILNNASLETRLYNAC